MKNDFGKLLRLPVIFNYVEVINMCNERYMHNESSTHQMFGRGTNDHLLVQKSLAC